MIYKIIIGKQEIQIDEDEKNFFVANQDKRFIELKSGEIVNTAFVQAMIMDEEASIEDNRILLKKILKGASEEEIPELKKLYDLNPHSKHEIKSMSDILKNNKKKLK